MKKFNIVGIKYRKTKDDYYVKKKLRKFSKYTGKEDLIFDLGKEDQVLCNYNILLKYIKEAGLVIQSEIKTDEEKQELISKLLYRKVVIDLLKF